MELYVLQFFEYRTILPQLTDLQTEILKKQETKMIGAGDLDLFLVFVVTEIGKFWNKFAS